MSLNDRCLPHPLILHSGHDKGRYPSLGSGIAASALQPAKRDGAPAGSLLLHRPQALGPDDRLEPRPRRRARRVLAAADTGALGSAEPVSRGHLIAPCRAGHTTARNQNHGEPVRLCAAESPRSLPLELPQHPFLSIMVVSYLLRTTRQYDVGW